MDSHGVVVGKEKQTQMEPVEVEIIEGTPQLSADPLPFARKYQLDALEAAIKQNTIVFLETGSGKTLIAIMLLRSYARFLRKPSPFVAVFLVPNVALVQQQSEALMMHTDLKVGKYQGGKGIGNSGAAWRKEMDDHEVLVMTPDILFTGLRHSFLKIDMIKVLVFDECHNARGEHSYARIMKEFYHQELNSNNSDLPRILGMTASPIKAKDCSSELGHGEQIRELENLMHSKIYTSADESVLEECIPLSTTKLKVYEHRPISYHVFFAVANELKMLRDKPDYSLGETASSESTRETRKKLAEICLALLFCFTELGVLAALKAAEFLSSVRGHTFLWGNVDVCGKTLLKNFCFEASKIFSARIQSDPSWNAKADMDSGYLTSKVKCLIESLLEYREVNDLRCIIFVKRIITASVLKILLNEMVPELSGWKAEYIVGYNSCTQTQSRNEQKRIIEEFRRGRVNIIVATSVLEEGLDVQNCNLVMAFDAPESVCSFIQCRGRARMSNSHFLILVKSGDTSALARVKEFLAGGETMRQQSLTHTSVPCAPLDDDLDTEAFYKVEATGAVVNLSSSVSLLNFYCSQLPSDGYFKPTPRFHFDCDSDTCTVHLPNGSRIRTVIFQGKPKKLKQQACLEACKQLHQNGALTDNLVPDIVEERKHAQQFGGMGFGKHIGEQVKFVPPELVGCPSNDSRTLYHCYLIELETDCNSDIKIHDIMLGLRTRLEFENETLNFDLDVNKGSLKITLRYHRVIELNPEEVQLCQQFQQTVLKALIDQNFNRLLGVSGDLHLRDECAVFDYLLLPTTGSREDPLIKWECVSSVLFPCGSKKHVDHSSARCHGCLLHTLTGPVCSCMLENCLVVTPHDDCLYWISGILDKLDSNSLPASENGGSITYKAHDEQCHNISLGAVEQPLLRGERVFCVQTYLQQCRKRKATESSKASVQLPPELCKVVMSPISIATFYSFSFAPRIMHRVESLLLAANLKRILADLCMQNDVIPTVKVLEAITTKSCKENFHLGSLATLGDSFLKYAVSQQLFKTYQDHHEGLLSIKRDKLISNDSLCKMGCRNKIQGFIRNEQFDPKTWIIPGDNTGSYTLDGKLISSRRMFYSNKRRMIKSKRVADVVKALIGAFLDSGDELAALSFMEWLGIKVDLICPPYTMPIRLRIERLVKVKTLESLFNYKFHDTCLLVEALTHGSCTVPEIPRCLQRLEFLGDALLDYLITVYLYNKHPRPSAGLLADLRSALAKNDCYAECAVRAGLHNHIIHAPQELQRQIDTSVQNFEKSSVSTFGCEPGMLFPKVLGDVIKSLAGAIFLDSGYSKEIVFESIRPLLEPMISPETLKHHQVRELNDLHKNEHHKMIVAHTNGKAITNVEVEADGVFQKNSSVAKKKSKEVNMQSHAEITEGRCVSMSSTKTELDINSPSSSYVVHKSNSI